MLTAGVSFLKGLLPRRDAALLPPDRQPAIRRSGCLLLSGDTASSDYLLRTVVVAPLAELWTQIDPARHRPDAQQLATVAQIVIARYLPAPWHAALVEARRGGARLVYFMDDDLMDARAVAELPRPYRDRVRRDALGQRWAIEALCSEFWVSTPYLADKYAAWQPRVLQPRPPRASLQARAPVWVCYHGTASHGAELDWLLPLLQQVQRSPAVQTRFEVFGDHAVYKRFRELPHVNVLHPMRWPNYLDYTAGVQRQIGLAPLLPSRFNAGRGPTKFFDFARMGAVGLYSDVAPYRGYVRHGVDGLLLPDDPAAWLQAILKLAADTQARSRMALAARARALELAY
ncbi:MAG: hypothetical protein QE285_03070 [Aquabacterium sp.]|nr:hypothetical protein [Aquabacterium sp.]